MHHVLFLIDRLHSTQGGAEGAVRKLCQFLPDYGFRCSVATFWAGDGVAKEFPCPVHIFPLSRIYDWTALRCGWAFSDLLRSERVEILHTFFPASDLWGGVVARLSGCPVLVSSRRDMGILRSRKHRLPYRLANGLFDQVQAVSNRVREWCLEEDRLAPDKVVTVYNGIDLNSVDEALAADADLAREWSAGGPVVVTVANIRFIKGIDVLVRAAALVLAEMSNSQFVIIGAALQEPGYADQLQETMRSLGIQRYVRFLGTRTDVCGLLKQADVFCLPSRSEGMSNALLEAMACRLPCVATDVGGNSEVIVEGQTGFLVPNESSHELAAKLLRLLRDPSLAKRMGEEGRRVVERDFTVHHMVKRLSDLYGDLLRKRGLSMARTSDGFASSEVPRGIGNIIGEHAESTVAPPL